jgi:6-phosphogluconate dehydrogenase
MSTAETMFDIGIVGLGVMGANLGWNFAEHRVAVIGLDRTADKIRRFVQGRDALSGTATLEATLDVADFVARLRRPRAILLLLPAGPAVDAVINELLLHLQREDSIIDGGNSHFPDTDRRAMRLAKRCIHFVGMGISGGEEGARRGPSLMPGGSKAAWEVLQPALEAAAAKVDGSPCVAWLGRNSAGHYVKMVHNGIEYGLMQLIAESYDLMRRGLGMDNASMQAVFDNWARGEMAGYLLEITADILRRHDPLGEGYLLDKILDAASQKGTGAWTSQEAMAIQVPTPVIDAAVAMRGQSGYKPQRIKANELFGDAAPPDPGARAEVLHHLGEALHGSMILTYAQGLHLLQQGSQAHGYGLKLADVVRIWRGGCIIRAQLLEDLRAVYVRDPALANPIFDAAIAQRIKHAEPGLRAVVGLAARHGLPAPGFMAALGYYDAWRSTRLPANLIQAQRDYFGAHTFERNDREGVFHVNWKEKDES